MSNDLWNLHYEANKEAVSSDFDTVTDWAANEIINLRIKIIELTEEIKYLDCNGKDAYL